MTFKFWRVTLSVHRHGTLNSKSGQNVRFLNSFWQNGHHFIKNIWNGPFHNPTYFDHFISRLVQILDPHCTSCSLPNLFSHYFVALLWPVLLGLKLGRHCHLRRLPCPFILFLLHQALTYSTDTSLLSGHLLTQWTPPYSTYRPSGWNNWALTHRQSFTFNVLSVLSV